MNQQDAYFSAAAQAAFTQVVRHSSDARAFVKAVATSVAQGHMKVWSAHDNEQQLLAGTPIAGALSTEVATPQVGVFFSDLT